MATTTTNLSLIKPAGSDFVLISDINTNSDTIDAAITKTAPVVTVTTLPGSPTDGQVIFYQTTSGTTPMNTDGIVWQLRYNASSASAYKWECVGGGSWIKEITTAENTASTTYVDLATVGPTIDVPLSGQYEIIVGADMSVSGFSSATTTSVSVKLGAAATTDNERGRVVIDSASGNASIDRSMIRTLATPSTLKAQYKTGTDTGRFQFRYLIVRPVRVG